MTFQKFLKLLVAISVSSTGTAIMLFISFIVTSSGEPMPAGNGLTILGLVIIGAAAWLMEDFLSMYTVEGVGFVGKDVKSEPASQIRRLQAKRRRKSSSLHVVGGRPWWS